VELAWDSVARSDRPSLRWYVQYGESTRVPGYTALYSAPGAGLFRGNATLGRENSRNLETGVQLRGGSWSLHAAVFQRRDDPLVDWTFTAGAPNARTARAVQIDNVGFEFVASRSWGAIDVVAGYTWLEKDADYFGAVVDASFYALNFPKHRFTVAVIAWLGGGFEVRSDNEYRVQEENLLRTVGGDSAVLSSLGVYWRSPRLEGFELSLVADNLWQSKFQELPAVPAPGRQVTLGAGWRW
jgi:outer membrane cobalamin receptor